MRTPRNRVPLGVPAQRIDKYHILCEKHHAAPTESRENSPYLRSTLLPIYEVFNKLKLPPEVGRAKTAQIDSVRFESRTLGTVTKIVGTFSTRNTIVLLATYYLKMTDH